MLSEILASVQRRLPLLLEQRDWFWSAAAAREPALDFGPALEAPGLSVIAEIKRASPSRGPIDPGLDPVRLALEYLEGGAVALSILTEPDHFHGSLDDLRSVRAAVGLPLLRKDFVVDRVQIWEARAAGADAVLLIVAALDDPTLVALVEEARSVGMAALVEVHTVEEVQRAHAAGAGLIGVNNRDLATFEVDLATAEDLAPHLAGDIIRVAESGIHTAEDARRMRAAGYDAVLVGESLVQSTDRPGLLESLRSLP